MPYTEVLEAETCAHADIKPHLKSFDSGQECSFDHLRELYSLLEVEDQELDGYVFDDTCLRVA